MEADHSFKCRSSNTRRLGLLADRLPLAYGRAPSEEPILASPLSFKTRANDGLCFCSLLSAPSCPGHFPTGPCVFLWPPPHERFLEEQMLLFPESQVGMQARSSSTRSGRSVVVDIHLVKRAV
jgi:hypothetical protein